MRGKVGVRGEREHQHRLHFCIQGKVVAMVGEGGIGRGETYPVRGR